MEADRHRPVVALVTDAIFPFHKGGKELLYYELAQGLARHAVVDVYTMKWWGTGATHEQGGLKMHALSPLLPLYSGDRRSIRQAVVFTLACLRLLTRRFDVIYADHMPLMQLFTLRAVATLRRKRLVATWHEVWGPEYWLRYMGGASGRLGWWIERNAVRLPDEVIADTPEVADRLRALIGDRVPVSVVPLGVDAAAIGRAEASGPLADVVVVGRMLEHKRIDLLIDAVAILRQRGVPISCRVIGDGPEREALHERARSAAVEDLVEFRHDVADQEELYSLLKASRAFVFPSEREGFGLAVLEALSCGLPVITTSAPDNQARHLATRSEKGTVCAPEPEVIASSIERVLDEEAASPGDGRAIEPWVQALNWPAVADRVADVVLR